ncbi:hypothetical protein DICA3_F25114 [Diutina catenulata]
MYIPKAYDEGDWQQVQFLIEKYPLATVVTEDLQANHFTFHLEQRGDEHVLIAHIAKANPQRAMLASGKPVLVVFQSHDSYISPSWYEETKPDTHKTVPTWCFAAAHIQGVPKVVDSEDFLDHALEALTTQEEGHRETPWKVSDAPERYTAIMKKAIIGLEIVVGEWQCKYKMDQNQKERDVKGVVRGLVRDDGKHAMSHLVEDTYERRKGKTRSRR